MSTDLNNSRESAQSTLFKAIEAGDTAAVLSILAERPELTQCTDDEGQTPLHLAAAFDDIRVALVLLSHGADVQARYGPFGHTPLSWAVTCNSQSFARGLIKLGVLPDLFVAAGTGELRLVQSFFSEAGELLPNASQTGSTRYANNGVILPCPPELPIEVISDALYIACRNSH